MRQLIFTGVVHPERSCVSLPPIYHPSLIDLEGNDFGSLKITIQCSQITAEFRTPSTEVDVLTLRNSIRPRIESIVDAYGFIVGCGYEVEIIQVLDSIDQNAMVLGVGIDSLRRNNEKNDIEKYLHKIISLCTGVNGAYFLRALGLLRSAIRNPFNCSLYCFLSIETLRNVYCKTHKLDPEKEKNKSWKILREDLGITKEFINANIKFPSDEIRHGGLRQFTEEERLNWLNSTWDVFNRYIEKHA